MRHDEDAASMLFADGSVDAAGRKRLKEMNAVDRVRLYVMSDCEDL